MMRRLYRARRATTLPWGLIRVRLFTAECTPRRAAPDAGMLQLRQCRGTPGAVAIPKRRGSGRRMGIKQRPSFVVLWPEQQKGDNERSVRSSAPIGWSLPPEAPDVMDLECREGGRKERIWGGGRLSSLSQTQSPKINSTYSSARQSDKTERTQNSIIPNYNPPRKIDPEQKTLLIPLQPQYTNFSGLREKSEVSGR